MCFIEPSRPSQLVNHGSLGNKKGLGNNDKYFKLRHPAELQLPTLHLPISNMADITEAWDLIDLPCQTIQNLVADKNRLSLRNELTGVLQL